jgi:Protein of unknown function (DUF2855)
MGDWCCHERGRVVQAQILGCGSPGAYLAQSCCVGGPTSAQSAAQGCLNSAIFHSCMVPSESALASQLPSWLNATPYTPDTRCSASRFTTGTFSRRTPAGRLDGDWCRYGFRRGRRHLGERLVHEAAVGVTHRDESSVQALGGPRTTVFFAPDQMRKRSGDWGREGLDQRFAEAWQRFADAAKGWVDVVTHHGPGALQEVWLEVLAGHSAPRTGHVLTF